MKILVIGSKGFIGANVVRELSEDCEVYGASRSPEQGNEHEKYVDLTNQASIEAVLEEVRPEAIINCAGVVENNDSAALNPIMTRNVLNSVRKTKIPIRNIVVLGSAAEYGVVEPDEVPVPESNPQRATAPYGLSKVEESEVVADFRDKQGLPIVTARLFNPIGTGMPSRQLIPRILDQIEEVKDGKRNAIEISRLDSERDYIDVQDVAKAIRILVQQSPKDKIYNIGSGKKTSNGLLVQTILKYSGVEGEVPIIETSVEKEPYFAPQANIDKMNSEFGWNPSSNIDDTIKEILDDQE